MKLPATFAKASHKATNAKQVRFGRSLLKFTKITKKSLAATITHSHQKSSTHSNKKLFAKKPTNKKRLNKKWAVFFILTLVILPALPMPANAAIFDPIIKVILPFYERIVGKEPTAPEPPTPTPTQDDTKPQSEPAKQVVVESPDTPTPDLFTLLYAEFAADRDDTDTALRLYKAESLKANAAPVFERALALSMPSESPAATLKFASDWQAKNSDHVPALFYTTHLALKSENYAAAAHYIKELLAYDPKADLGQIFAGILPETREARRALFTEIQSIDIHQNPSFSVLKAGLLGQLDEPIPAILHLNNAIAADPNNLAYYLLKADIIKGYKPSELDKFLKESIKATHGDTKKQLYLYHARHLLDQNDLKGAWQVLESAGNLLAQDGEMALLGGLLALDLNRYDDANRLLMTLIDDPESKSEAYYYLGIGAERVGDIDLALEYFAQADDMQYAMHATKKQVAYQMLFGNTDAAIASLIKLRQNFEMYASDSYLMQADILKELGKKDEAYALLSQAYDTYPDEPALLYAKIGFMQDDNEKTQAIATLLEFDPNNPRYRLLAASHALAKNPHNAIAKKEAIAIATMSDNDPDFDEKEQLEAALLVAQLAYDDGDYQAVIETLAMPHTKNPSLQTGTLLLWAYQKLGKTQEVQRLLTELQGRFGNKSTP